MWPGLPFGRIGVVVENSPDSPHIGVFSIKFGGPELIFPRIPFFPILGVGVKKTPPFDPRHY